MTWPRLTELDGPKSPNQCQRCGGGNDLQRWQECDDNDRKENRVVVLCKACGDEVIEPHPRLYHFLLNAEPFPGAMGVCLECIHRDGVTCTCPDAAINGGRGLTYTPEPANVHLCARGGKGGWRSLCYPKVEGCSGRVAVDKV